MTDQRIVDLERLNLSLGNRLRYALDLLDKKTLRISELELRLAEIERRGYVPDEEARPYIPGREAMPFGACIDD